MTELQQWSAAHQAGASTSAAAGSSRAVGGTSSALIGLRERTPTAPAPRAATMETMQARCDRPQVYAVGSRLRMKGREVYNRVGK